MIAKLNPFLDKWPLELVLISGFFSVKRMRVFDSPQWFVELALISGFCSVKRVTFFDSPWTRQ